MTEPIRTPAPDPVGDIVAGHPPVPITVWQLPAAHPGETLSAQLAQRLVGNFTHPRTVVLDYTDGDHLARAVTTARRRHTRTPADPAGAVGAALIVAGWPRHAGTADDFLGSCAARLTAGGCAAIVLEAGELTVNQVLIGAARRAGLTYLQHVVAAHDPSSRRGQLTNNQTHLRTHTDVLIFMRGPGAADV